MTKTYGRLAAGAALTGLLLASAHASGKDPRKLGTQWDGPDGNTHVTQLGLEVRVPASPDPALFRDPAFDWRRSDLQAGWYPKHAFAKRVGGTVEMDVDVDAAGAPQACRVAVSSGDADLDAHACPHVLAHVRFVPALPRDGVPRAGTLRAALHYDMGPLMMSTAVDGPNTPDPSRVDPLQPIDAATAGIAGAAAPEDVSGVGITLAVGSDGTPVACRLQGPTHNDAWDKRICDSLLERVRFPASTAGGDRLHTSWIMWPASEPAQ